MKISAGILLYRRSQSIAASTLFDTPSSMYEFLLVHPGGPFWAKKDEHAWSIPKGEMEEAEEIEKTEKRPNAGAQVIYSRRSFEEAEEMEEVEEIAKTEKGPNAGAPVIYSGLDIEATARREFAEETGQPYPGQLIPLPPVKTSGGKIIHAFLGTSDFDPSALKSNLFEMEWPPRSGKTQSFPEVDRAAWFDAETSFAKIHKGQAPIIEFALEFLLK